MGSRVRHFACTVLALLATAATSVHAQVNVTTYHNDLARSGQNTQETILTPTNVNSSQFGKLFTVAVDGQVFAQPLYMAGVSIAGGTHNVLYVATEHDSIYAIDADSGTVYWHISLIPAGGRTVAPDNDIGAGCNDILTEVGITGTPVIDPSSNTLYVVAASMVGGKGVQYLHAIDIGTSLEKFGGPVNIQASVPGNGYDAVNSVVAFNALNQNQRAGLMLQNGNVVIAWASHCDYNDWHGWVMSYGAKTLAQQGVFNSTPNGQEGGIWMGGGGIAADANGNMFLATGNGDWNGTTDFADSILRLGPATNGSLPVLDYFTPFDQASLQSGDIDVASSSPILLPTLPSGQQLLAHMGKLGTLYVVNRNNMGHYCANQTPACTSDTQIVQEIPNASTGVWGTPAYWNGNIYWGAQNDNLAAFSFNTTTGSISKSPSSSTPQEFGYPAPTPSISANGSTNGILWAIDGSAYGSTCSGTTDCEVLYAYSASNLGTLLYSSNQAANNRDVPGPAVKFATPTISNGKVYVGSQYAVSAYGLLNATSATGTTPSPVLSPAPGTYSTVQTVTLSDSAAGATIYYTTNGTTPTTSSSVYSTPLTVSATTTIQAIAVAGAGGTSSAVTGAYTLVPSVVSIAGSANATAFAPNGTAINNGGIDFGNNAYSANLLGTSLTWAGETFAFGASNAANNAVRGGTIPLPPGNYANVAVLGTAVDGAQTNQIFTINYSDGTSTSYTQSLSDWTLGPQGYSGESTVLTMPYHIGSGGATVTANTYLYGYMFAPNSAKTVVSLTTPNNSNVVILAVDVSPVPVTTQTPPAAAPTFGTASGNYSTPQSVSLADGTPGATIYYTVNGTVPTTNSTPYTGPITVSATETINALAVAPNYAVSAVATATYTFPAIQTSYPPGEINLSGIADVVAIGNDGVAVADGGIDYGGNVYSATLLGATLNWAGQTFTFGTPGTANADVRTTIPLPAGNYSSVSLLATAVNGAQPGNPFTINYSDGSTTTVTQSLSDWTVGPQGYPGETTVLTMSYHDNAAGAPVPQTTYLYGYTFALNSAKTAVSLSLPVNDNIVILAVDVSSSAVTTTQTPPPTISPAPGAYSAAQQITLSDTNAGAAIYYTINGSQPSVNSTLYTAPFTISNSATVNAVALARGDTLSAESTAAYTISTGTLPVGDVPLSSVASIVSITNDGTPVPDGGIDYSGNAYSASLLGSSVTWNGQVFTFGTPGVYDATAQSTIALPPGNYTSVSILATAVDGAQTNQVFTINYTDGSSTQVTQSLSDWTIGPQGYTGESTVLTMTYHDNSSGVPDAQPTYLYGYTFPANSAKTAKSLSLPNNANVVVLAVAVSPGTATTTTPTFTLAPAAGAVSVAQGASGTDALTVSDANGFAGAVSFSALGLPAGATASFTPATSTSGTTVSFTTAATTPTGTSTVTITGTSGSTVVTTAVNLTVTAAVAPAFGLTGAAAVSVTQGASTVDTITVTPANGFTGAVSFSATGLPAGVTASFAPVSSTSGTQVTFAAAATTPTGTSTVTVTGTSGNTVVTSTVALTVASTTTGSSCPTTLGSLNGWYGVLVQGSTTGASPAAKYLTGALLFNGAGGISGSNIYSGAGAGQPATGSYVVNADCSLTINLTVGTSAAQVYTVGITAGNEAVGIETDGSAVATIDLQAQYATVTTGLNFTSSSLNGTYATSCYGPQGSYSDLNLVTFSNGTLSGTDPYNNNGSSAGANVPYTGTYTVNTDGTFSGALTVEGTPFDFYGVISAGGKEVEYIYSAVSNGVPTAAFSACAGGTALAAATPGFTLAPSSNPLSLQQNAGGTATVAVTDINGFAGAVSLAVSGLPTGASGTFVGNTLVVFPAITVPVGTYPLTITGTSGAITATTSLNLVITAGADFSLTPATGTLNVTAGQSATDAISVVPTGGFTGTVSFSASGLPTGATASFAPTTSTTGSTLSIATTSTTASGNYLVTITGTSPGTGSSNPLTVTSTVVLVVGPGTTGTPGFTLASASGTESVAQGQSVSDAITITPTNGFAGAVSFTATGLPAGATATFSPASSTTGTTVSFAAAATTPTGTSSVTITGTSGSTVVSTTVALSVTGSAGNVTVVNLASVYNVYAIANTGSAAPSGGFDTQGYAYAAALLGSSLTWNAETFTLGKAGSPSGVSSTVVALPPGNYTALNFLAGAANGAQLNQNFIVTYSDGTTTSYVQSLNDWGAAPSYSGEATAASTTYRVEPNGSTQNGPWYVFGYTIPLNSAKTATSLTLPANRDVIVLAVDLANARPPAGFTLTPATSGLSVVTGQSVNDAITITPTNGFTGTVSFTASGLPAGATASFSPASSATGTTVSIATASTTPVGTTTITITGTSGSTVVTTTFNLTVGAAPTFTLAAGSSTSTVVQGSSGTDAITITPLNGFSGTVSFSASGLPAGATASLSPASSTSGTTVTFTTSSTTPAGTSTVTITGTAGALVVTTTVNLTVIAAPTFTLSIGSNAVALAEGASGTDTVSIMPVNGFSSTVSFTASGLPAGATATFSPASSTTGTTVIFATAATTPIGTYPVTISGTVGSLVQTITINLTVSAPASGPTQVSLASFANVYAIANNGTAPVHGGIDNASYAYSANVLGTSVTWNGETFALGAAGTASAVSISSIPLPAGSYTTLNFLGTAVNGAQLNQQFIVNYSDGSSTVVTQSLSDWVTYTSFAGQSIVSTMSYRVTPTGGTQTAGIHLFGYSIVLNPAKTVSSLQVPSNRNVVLLAVGLSGAGTVQPSFSLAPAAASLTLAQGGSGTDAITATPSGGFTGTISFSASGLPVGATATFSPASSTTASTLSVSAAASTAAGTYPVTITGTSGSTSATTTVQLTVTAAPTPIVPYVYVNGTWTEEASATVSAGATVDLGPQPLTGGSWSWAGPNGYTSTARQINSIPLSTGVNTYVATYTNAAGAKSTATFTITVTATSTFSLAAKATTVKVTPPTCILIVCFGGVAGTDAIAVSTTNGFSGVVSFTVSGLPADVTGKFSPATVTGSGTSTLTLTPANGAASGKTATLTITGTSGSGSAATSASTTITLDY